MTPRKRMAVFKFASCDGCQLSLLDCEDELLAIAGAIEIAHFPEASSAMQEGPYDLVLVEGSITTPEDAERIQRIRAQAAVLVTLGACATAGGIQALRNYADVSEFASVVYARPDYIETLATSTAVADHVPVDFELRGCPIDRYQLLELLTAYLHGKRPTLSRHSLCIDCKQAGVVCVLVSRGVPCLGPATQSGCGVLCPRHDRGCYGCFGPSAEAHFPPLSERLLQLGVGRPGLRRLYRTFNAGAPALVAESQRQDPAEPGGPGGAP